MEKEYYIYMWYYKNSGEVFYIGKGKNNRYKKLKQSRNEYFKNIINKEKDNVDVKFYKTKLLEKEALDLERQLIHEYWDKGQCKANFHEGGSGGNTGKYSDPERSRKLSESAKKRIGAKNPMYGKHHSEETKAKLRKINLGKKLSEEHKQALIKANIGRKKTPAEIERIRNLNLGKKMKPEVKQKMIESLCPFEYKIYLNNELKYTCLGHTALWKYCKEEFNISKTIIEKVIKKEWKPTFNKHKWLETLRIEKIERCID